MFDTKLKNSSAAPAAPEQARRRRLRLWLGLGRRHRAVDAEDGAHLRRRQRAVERLLCDEPVHRPLQLAHAREVESRQLFDHARREADLPLL
jgi:hypothetical protein